MTFYLCIDDGVAAADDRVQGVFWGLWVVAGLVSNASESTAHKMRGNVSGLTDA